MLVAAAPLAAAALAAGFGTVMVVEMAVRQRAAAAPGRGSVGDGVVAGTGDAAVDVVAAVLVLLVEVVLVVVLVVLLGAQPVDVRRQ